MMSPLACIFVKRNVRKKGCNCCTFPPTITIIRYKALILDNKQLDCKTTRVPYATRISFLADSCISFKLPSPTKH